MKSNNTPSTRNETGVSHTEPPVSPTLSLDQQDMLLGLPENSPIRQRINKLTETERIAFDAIVAGKTFSEAARIAGCSRQHAYALKGKICDLMERRGLTDELLLSKLEDLMDAEEVRIFAGYQGGRPIMAEPQPALDIRLRALDLATKFKGWHRTVDAEDVSRDSHDINVNIIHVGGDSK